MARVVTLPARSTMSLSDGVPLADNLKSAGSAVPLLTSLTTASLARSRLLLMVHRVCLPAGTTIWSCAFAVTPLVHCQLPSRL